MRRCFLQSTRFTAERAQGYERGDEAFVHCDQQRRPNTRQRQYVGARCKACGCTSLRSMNACVSFSRRIWQTWVWKSCPRLSIRQAASLTSTNSTRFVFSDFMLYHLDHYSHVVGSMCSRWLSPAASWARAHRTSSLTCARPSSGAWSRNAPCSVCRLSSGPRVATQWSSKLGCTSRL